jgi:glucan phosphoethanolaminetransferase (alkaline phosphatase superfamily)
MSKSIESPENTDRVIEPSSWYLALLLLICAPVVADLLVTKSPHAAIALVVQFIVFVAFFLAFHWSKRLVLVWALFSLLATFDALYYYEYRDALSLRALTIALQTPLYETVTFIAARASLFLSVFFLWGFVIFRIYRAPAPSPVTRRAQKYLKRICVVACILFAGFALHTFSNVGGTLAPSSVNFGGFLIDNVANSYPYKPIYRGLIYRESDAKYESFQARKLSSDIAGRVRQIPSFKQDGKPVAVILVLGESSNRSRWSLYGYERVTTPSLARRSGLVLLENVVTPWPSTLASVPVILTQKSASDVELYTSEPGLSRILGAAGYETYWISNQGHSGNFDRSIKQLYSEAQFQEFAGGATALAIGQPGDDMRLLPAIEHALLSKREKVFLVIHTQGSHYPFWERYPLSSERFKPAKREEEFFNNRIRNRDWQSVSNSYDNSIVHTDHVLDQIIETASKSGRDTRLVYVSDHGQSIPNASCAELGQGYANDAVLKVPAFVWLSSDLTKIQPQWVLALKKNAREAISTTSVFPTVLSLAGVELDGSPPDTGLTSSQFVPSPQIVNTAQGAVNMASLASDGFCK